MGRGAGHRPSARVDCRVYDLIVVRADRGRSSKTHEDSNLDGAPSGDPPIDPGPDGDGLRLDDQICFALYTASHAVMRAYRPLLADVGLTYPQYLTMLALWEDAEREHTVGELGARLHLDSATLTPLLKRLESAGLVRRRRDEHDERRVLVAVTDAGRAARARAAGVPRALAACVGLDPAEAARLRAELLAVVATLDAGPPDPADRGPARPRATRSRAAQPEGPPGERRRRNRPARSDHANR